MRNEHFLKFSIGRIFCSYFQITIELVLCENYIKLNGSYVFTWDSPNQAGDRLTVRESSESFFTSSAKSARFVEP